MKTKNETPRALQKLLIISLIITWVVSMIQIAALAAMQYSSNPNLSSFVSWTLMTFVVPAVLLGIIYATRKNKRLTIKTIFEVAVASVAALALYGAMMQLSVLVPPPMFANGETFMYYQLIASGVPLILTGSIIALLLIKMRRADQW